MRLAKIIAFNLLTSVIALLVVLKLFDVYLVSHRHSTYPDEDADAPTMRTMEYYPFTGGQIQAYKREQGRLPWANTTEDIDIQSGEYGFFISFRLEAPPPKQDNEIRIVLTGGSAAQGFGARTNADMFYQLLPAELTKGLREHNLDCKVTIVNLAMAASHIYQNFVALNKWAHPLQPDAIISFSGHNEIAVFEMTNTDADELAYQAGGLLHVMRYSASPRWLKTMAEYYPGIVRRTMFGALVRLMYLRNYSDDWQAAYFLSRTDPTFGPMDHDELQQKYRTAIRSFTWDEVIDRISIPIYEHSLESISRDFPGTPIYAVFQPLARSQELYTRLTNAVPAKVNGQDHYDNIKFLNLQRVWEDHDFYPGSLVDSVHLSNEGQMLVATFLNEQLFPFVQRRCSALNTPK